MTIPFDANLDVTLVRGRSRRRYRIENHSAGGWLITLEREHGVVTCSVSTAEGLIEQHQVIVEAISELEREGWETKIARVVASDAGLVEVERGRDSVPRFRQSGLRSFQSAAHGEFVRRWLRRGV